MAKETRPSVILFLPSLAGGGAEQMMLRVAEGLSRHGLAVELVVVSAKGRLLERVPDQVPVVDLGVSRPSRAVPALWRHLRRRRPDVLFATLTQANLGAIWATRLAGIGTRCVIREAANLSHTLAHEGALTRALLPWLVRWTYPRADTIVALSEGVADDLSGIAGLARDSIDVIYNPLDANSVEMLGRSPLEHPWFAPGSPPVVLAAGRLCVQKGFDVLLDAFAMVRRRYDARLIILGDGELRGALCRQVSRLGLGRVVQMPGFVSNPFSYMSRAAVFAFPSRWEGLGNSLLEAMACGIPIAAADCPSGPSEVLEGGRYGRLVPVGDIAAWAQVLEDGLEGRIAPPPVHALQRFNPHLVMEQLIDLLLPVPAENSTAQEKPN